MLNTINNDTDANVTMKYSRLSDTFTVTADSGGKDSKVSIVNITGNAFESGGAFQIASGTTRNGCNSLAEINGTLVEKDSNQYTVDGNTSSSMRLPQAQAAPPLSGSWHRTRPFQAQAAFRREGPRSRPTIPRPLRNCPLPTS
jgi:hypothetical protein